MTIPRQEWQALKRRQRKFILMYARLCVAQRSLVKRVVDVPVWAIYALVILTGIYWSVLQPPMRVPIVEIPAVLGSALATLITTYSLLVWFEGRLGYLFRRLGDR